MATYGTNVRRGLLIAVLMTAAYPARAGSMAPYGPSPVIRGVTWDFKDLIRLANTPGNGGSDLWPVTWAEDGNVYTSFGDGGGFSGASDGLGRVSIGFARIAGFPPDIKGTDVWGSYPKYARHPATFCGKCGSMISVGGVIYAWVESWYNSTPLDFVQCGPNPFPPRTRMAWSRDLGKTWQLSRWAVTEKRGRLDLAGQFLNFGRDDAGARDRYVYQYLAVRGRGTGTYLARVLPGKLTDDPSTAGFYEYYSGPGPTWSRDKSKASPVFVDKHRRRITHVIYDPGIHRYIASEQGYGVGQLGLFDSPEPWGPWTTIGYYKNWGGFGERESLGVDFSTKWISRDGRTLWAVFSGGRLKPTDDELDSFNLVRLTLVLRKGGR
ncbi:MAG: hypothetical protein ACREFX_00030 [Opitutaceae bacterium]